MINDVQMLRFIMKNAEMGCRNINHIKHYANTPEMSKALRTQNLEYGRIYHSAWCMLKKRGAETRHVHPATIVMSKAVADRELRKDDSNSHIAEMMIQGNSMGVQKIARHIRQYGDQNKNITYLANKLMSTEQANIEQMRSFL